MRSRVSMFAISGKKPEASRIAEVVGKRPKLVLVEVEERIGVSREERRSRKDKFMEGQYAASNSLRPCW